MKIAMIAFSVKGAMGQYLETLVSELRNYLDICLVAPKSFGQSIPNVRTINFETAENKILTLKTYLNLRWAKDVWHEIISGKPDLIYIFNGEGYPWSPLFARWASKEGIPLLMTIHDPKLHPGASLWERMNGLTRRLVVPHARSVHVHSKLFIDTAKQLGAKDVEVIPHLSIADRFLKHRKNDVERNEKLALFFGRIEAYKGLDVFVRAMLYLNGRKKGIIAGPGRIPGRIVRIVKQYPQIFEVENRFIPDEEVAVLFQRASVLVLPYKQATQSSLPCIGAAFGLPVVATAIGGFLEDVPKVGGILVEPNDHKALAKAILEARVRCRPSVPEEFLPSNVGLQFYKWFIRVVEGKKKDMI